jgi:hypothetical protein
MEDGIMRTLDTSTNVFRGKGMGTLFFLQKGIKQTFHING